MIEWRKRASPGVRLPPCQRQVVYFRCARQRAIARLKAIKLHVAAGSASTCARAGHASYRCLCCRACFRHAAGASPPQRCLCSHVAAGSASSCKSRARELPLSWRGARHRHAAGASSLHSFPCTAQPEELSCSLPSLGGRNSKHDCALLLRFARTANAIALLEAARSCSSHVCSWHEDTGSGQAKLPIAHSKRR